MRMPANGEYRLQTHSGDTTPVFEEMRWAGCSRRRSSSRPSLAQPACTAQAGVNQSLGETAASSIHQGTSGNKGYALRLVVGKTNRLKRLHLFRQVTCTCTWMPSCCHRHLHARSKVYKWTICTCQRPYTAHLQYLVEESLRMGLNTCQYWFLLAVLLSHLS